MTRAALLAATLGAAALLSACSSAPVSATSGLQRDVSALTDAAAARNLPRARAALSTLTADLRVAYATGAISQARYDQIVANISAVAHDLGTADTTSTARTTASTARTTTSAARTTTSTARTTTSAAAQPTSTPISHASSVADTPPKPPTKSKTHGHGGGGNGNG